MRFRVNGQEYWLKVRKEGVEGAEVHGLDLINVTTEELVVYMPTFVHGTLSVDGYISAFQEQFCDHFVEPLDDFERILAEITDWVKEQVEEMGGEVL